MSDSVLLDARHVTKSFGRLQVLTDANLVVRRGELVGVTGENGCGKTTLLKIVVGLLEPDAGELARHGRLGYCPQESLVFERLTVAENFAYFATGYGIGGWRPAMKRWVEFFGFGADADRLVDTLSGGTRQKLNLALALLHDPTVLLLDEPYAGFDWETYLRFWELAEVLRAEGRGVLVVSHFMYDQARLDRVCELREGVLTCV
ncbi:MAG: ATP-binding cassette domain-containing protein [Gemmatimonadales bacterium]|nr:ATP-binding cassette domain-containing protein [Gemmatimonadales bacterium]NIN11145.1 ATP-binding cassette domain-containing protein [Gemmatimonadales bacterium]NIN49744.1 ATP-binding cassette domain-containing protein [Gemmatimonadales bacterium]NIP07208.1 ATP-binding cassette domain-containing protein [Gemmatimonadales bacterium]NIR00421.1 ATP-binding cassette domain-containing protein [Gemmatimonadales bacterium]